MSSDYYVYGYIRKIASMDGPAGSFYYIGKGMGDRARANHGHIHVPKDPKRIVMIKVNLTEEDAFSLEKSQIKEYGRIDNGTGCLRNLTDGGEGPSGYKFTEEQCAKNSAARKKYFEDPEARAKQSATLKKYFEDPEARAKQSATLKKYFEDPEARAKNSAARKKYFEDPEARAKQSAIRKKYFEDPEARAKNSAIRKKYFEDPEARAKNSAARKKYWENPEARAKMSATQKIVRGTPESRVKNSATMKAVWTARRANQSKNHATLDQFIT